MNWEYFGEGGKSLKRLIPFVAFLVLVIELIISFLPFIVIADNNLQIINNINEVLGWIIGAAFVTTAAEKFSKGRNRNITKTENETETTTDIQG